MDELRKEVREPFASEKVPKEHIELCLKWAKWSHLLPFIQLPFILAIGRN